MAWHSLSSYAWAEKCCYVLNYVSPKNSYVEVLTPNTSEFEYYFGARTFTEVIKFK